MRMGFDRNGEITDRGRNLNYSTKGTYGTSGFMTLEEMHQVLELTNDVKKHKGTILGKLNGKAVCLPKDTRMNRNIAVSSVLPAGKASSSPIQNRNCTKVQPLTLRMPYIS